MKAAQFTATLRRNRQITIPMINIIVICKELNLSPNQLLGCEVELHIKAIHINNKWHSLYPSTDDTLESEKVQKGD